MCWGQDIPFLPYESWSLAFRSCFPLKSSFHQIQIPWERVECWGDYHLKHKSKELMINTPSITFWRVVSPRLARCHLGDSVKIVELNQGVCMAMRLPTSWRSTLVRQVLHGRWPWWDRQGCFFVDPSLVDSSVDSRTVTLRGLKSPSTWMYDSTPPIETTPKISVSFLHLHSSNPSLYYHMQCLTFRFYTLRIACVGWLLDLC